MIIIQDQTNKQTKKKSWRVLGKIHLIFISLRQIWLKNKK